ncbi:tumor necrosis factor alpha-induced protein 8-like protein 1 [Phasianus colchicus]|uniref:Tumor necrosis factor alpha-induced protein 8-like protein 1 n=1 Tax=Phasianus colchicus TaxID=9054 RepID=A0A669QJS4_PHACC|nr:tumor necrosis factor alpha-induced protein 8-like protein 1 [Phasianus colchicus]
MSGGRGPLPQPHSVGARPLRVGFPRLPGVAFLGATGQELSGTGTTAVAGAALGYPTAGLQPGHVSPAAHQGRTSRPGPGASTGADDPGARGKSAPSVLPCPAPIGSFVASPASSLASTAIGHRPRCSRARPRSVRSSPGAPGTAAYGVPVQRRCVRARRGPGKINTPSYWRSPCGSGAEMDTFSTKSLALQAQKKLLSKMASKTMANVFIDDTSSEILDELYRATKEYTHNRKEAQKIIKNLIKIVMKLGVLYRNGQFSPEELMVMERFRKKVHTLAMTAVSFHQIDFTFDRRVMSSVLTECRDLLHQAVSSHLTAKSHSRINHVFNHFADYEFLSALYGPAEPYRTHLKRICEGVNKMLEEDNI